MSWPGPRLALSTWLVVGAWLGCESRPSPSPLQPLRTESPRPAPTRTSAGTAFDLGEARGCRFERVDLRLSELTPTVPGSVAPDALVLRTQVRCDAGQQVLAGARLVWVPPDGPRAWLPSDRTRVAAPEAEVLQRVFEVPPALRLDPSGPFGELRVRSPSGDIDVLLDARLPRREAAPPEADDAQDACSRRTRRLREQLAGRFAQAPRGGSECNVMGWLVPSRCRELAETALLDEALTQRRACDEPHVRPLSRGGREPPPDDFRIALRRDRCPGSLDTCPRYTLAVYANGVTVFHGEHLVNALGRSDGRTHPTLVAGLWQRVKELDLLGRPGAHGQRAERCGARGSDRGALLTVQGGGKSRTLVDREDCRAPFTHDELAQVAEWIDAVAGVAAWTDPAPAYADRQVRIWDVSAE